MRKTFVLAIAAALINTTTFAAEPHYAIIVDAGSSGSRLHLFQYEEGKTLPVINDVFSEKTSMPLASYASNPAAAGESFKKLLDDAMQKLQTAHADPQQVAVSILGTAGMRLLPQETQDAIYSNVTSYIKNNYAFSIADIETISGKMEGLYGWLDVNYLAKTFEQNRDVTKGSIDMGGASTQLVFSTNDTSKPDDEITFNLAGKTYTVFSKSFLGLGQDQALAAITQSPYAAACYPHNYAYNQTNVGNFDFAGCGILYTALISDQHVSEAIPDTAQREFVAYSGIYYADNFFGVDTTPDQATVGARIKTVCSKSWEQLQQDYPSVAPKYLATYCANGAYFDKLLYETYLLKGRQLTVTTKINQKDIDWTLGALLYQIK